MSFIQKGTIDELPDTSGREYYPNCHKLLKPIPIELIDTGNGFIARSAELPDVEIDWPTASADDAKEDLAHRILDTFDDTIDGMSDEPDATERHVLGVLNQYLERDLSSYTPGSQLTREAT